MTSPAVKSSFDVAYWFVDRALNDGEYLQPQKMHRLLYLAQAYFAVAFRGRPLMPAFFVVDEVGPIEPNVYRACALQRPAIEDIRVGEQVAHFLDSVWRRFGHHSAEFLNRQVSGHPPYAKAQAEGIGTIISMASMIEFYGRKQTEEDAEEGAPPVTSVLRPRVLRSQDGKAVAVRRWSPPAK